MSFEIRTFVKIINLSQKGEIVECLGDDKYRVSIGSLKIVCKGSDLVLIDPPKNKTKVVDLEAALSYNRHREDRIDLHGMTTSEAIDALEKRISDGLISGLARLEIVHGFGKEKIMRAVEEYLKKSKYVARFQRDSKNQGVTIAYF